MREILSVSDCIRFLRSRPGLFYREALGSDSAAVSNRETSHQQNSPKVLPVERRSARVECWENQPVHVEVVHQEQPSSEQPEGPGAGSDPTEQQDLNGKHKPATEKHETENAPAPMESGKVP